MEGLLGFIVEPYMSEEGSAFKALSVDEYVNSIDHFYENTAIVKGMGENDLGVTFAGCAGDPLFDEESVGVIKGVVEGIKSKSRHGVPFYVRSSGLTLDPEDVRNGFLQEVSALVS